MIGQKIKMFDSGACYGDATLDECGICEGDGIPTGDCDCNGNVLDECGVCDGSGPDQHFTCDGTFKPETKDALQVAVDLWTCTRFEYDCDNELALSTYGHISNWDVSLITDMTDIFNGK